MQIHLAASAFIRFWQRFVCVVWTYMCVYGAGETGSGERVFAAGECVCGYPFAFTLIALLGWLWCLLVLSWLISLLASEHLLIKDILTCQQQPPSRSWARSSKRAKNTLQCCSIPPYLAFFLLSFTTQRVILYFYKFNWAMLQISIPVYTQQKKTNHWREHVLLLINRWPYGSFQQVNTTPFPFDPSHRIINNWGQEADRQKEDG